MILGRRPEGSLQERWSVVLRNPKDDSAAACIYFQERGNLARAQDLGDALVQAMHHDSLGGGRIAAATIYGRLIEPDQNSTEMDSSISAFFCGQ